jgi:two-component system, OmpR family, sensor histidine kinase BaeS
MARRHRSWIGQLGLQLALAFVGVALAAVVAAIAVNSVRVSGDIDRLVHDQQSELLNAVAVAAGSAYDADEGGWAHANLSLLTAAVEKTGSAFYLRDQRDHLVAESPNFSALVAAGGADRTEAVLANGHRIGTVTIAFGRRAAGQEIRTVTFFRWESRLAAAGIAVLIALLVALPLSRLITAPVDRLIWASHARRRGDRTARVGRVPGFRKLNELSAAFDEMADTREEQEQVRRNLVADVAHELRNPIAVLQAGHEAMLDGLTEPSSEHLVSLRDEVLRLARMVDDLQRLASAEAAALQLTLIRRDLAAVAATAAASLVDAFEVANVTLVERLAEIEVWCDPLRMHEVVVNLLTNALKFTPAGGMVTLQTRQADRESAQLVVSDTGIGIPPDELPHVAERFFRGQRSSEVAGSGIGLTIVAELIRAHHGELDFASTQGAGTKVTVTLPLADSRRPGDYGTSRRPASGGRRRGTSMIHRDTGSADAPELSTE